MLAGARNSEEVTPFISCSASINAHLFRISAVAMLLASAVALGEEFRFGGWSGKIDVNDSIPIFIQASHFEGEASSSLRLMCTPSGWIEGSETASKPVHQGLLMDHSSGLGVQRKQEAVRH